MSVLEKRPSKANSSLQLVGAVDQGTSSTRFLIFNAKTAELVTFHQMEVPQLFPNEGWVEEDAQEILKTVHRCIEVACHNLTKMNISTLCVKAIGITNQRETTVMWDKNSGYPLHNAIVWCDNRTTTTVDELIAKTPDKSQDYLKKQCGLPISTYFSAVKVRWLLDNRPSVKKAVDNKYALFGTIDSWLLWNLTGGTAGGQHVTDITNASRTMLFNINHEQWDPKLLEFFDIPHHILPDVRSNSEVYGHMTSGPLKGVPLSGCLGDQQAALVGHMCFKPGDAKNTYGTGCFLLQNTGTKAVMSQHGMLTTVAYQLGKDAPVHYALEGSIAVAGGLVRWLRDNLEIIKDSAEIELLARTVENSGDVVFVPAFSGLYAPYWRSDARGTVCGITQWTTKAHIAYAALEAVCFQTREIIEAMEKDACDNPQDSTGGSNAQGSTRGSSLQVDGGMTNNQLLLQIQADILGKTVLKPSMPETTALGAAMAAGHAIGVWSLDPRDLTSVTFERFQPAANHDEIEARYRKWKRAVQKSMGWTFPASHDASD